MRLASLPFHKVRTINVTLGELNYAEPRAEAADEDDGLSLIDVSLDFL
jgi:hypothetical protein